MNIPPNPIFVAVTVFALGFCWQFGGCLACEVYDKLWQWWHKRPWGR